jgi:hypothetical protein
MLVDLTFPCYLTTFSGKICLSGKVICPFFVPLIEILLYCYTEVIYMGATELLYGTQKGCVATGEGGGGDSSLFEDLGRGSLKLPHCSSKRTFVW